jgi:hypothetical protein
MCVVFLITPENQVFKRGLKCIYKTSTQLLPAIETFQFENNQISIGKTRSDTKATG